MKILKKGKKDKIPTYILECPGCGCIAEFTNFDVKTDLDGRFVVCPQCGRFTNISSSAIKTKEEWAKDYIKRMHE